MATVIVCDGGCGKQSPDAKGYHIANAWTQVQILEAEDINHVGVRWEQSASASYIFCGDCWLRVRQALPA